MNLVLCEDKENFDPAFYHRCGGPVCTIQRSSFWGLEPRAIVLADPLCYGCLLLLLHKRPRLQSVSIHLIATDILASLPQRFRPSSWISLVAVIFRRFLSTSFEAAQLTVVASSARSLGLFFLDHYNTRWRFVQRLIAAPQASLRTARSALPTHHQSGGLPRASRRHHINDEVFPSH